MDIPRALIRVCLGLVSAAALQGCVLGYGGCKLTDPVKTSLTGHVHFRDYRDETTFDRAPILVLDRTEYIYAPAAGKQCQSAMEMQLLPLTDLPDNIAEGAHVRVQGSIVQANQRGQRTRYVFNMATVQLLK
jgi:hypothetical protein